MFTRLSWVLVAVGCASPDGGMDEAESKTARAQSVPCMLPDDSGMYDPLSGEVIDTKSTRDCRAMGGSVPQLDIDVRLGRTASSGPGGNGTPAPAGNGPAPGGVLTEWRTSGIGDLTYLPEFDCDDFAHLFELWLEDAGYHGTFTVIRWKDVWGKWHGHAITDVHIDGVTWWVDPQNGSTWDLDADDNGWVDTNDFGDFGGSEDDDLSVQVYEDRAEGEQHEEMD